MTTSDERPRNRRRRPPRRSWFHPEVPDILLLFAAGILIPQMTKGTPAAAAIYGGTGLLGLWYTMRTEWRRNRRQEPPKRDSGPDDNGAGRS